MRYWLGVVLAFVASVAYAQPTITGVTQSGTTMTIAGSGFGAKASAAPVKWDDFQSFAVGSPITGGSGAPWVPGGSIPPIASSDRPRPGTPNTKNMLSVFHPTGNGDPSASNVFVRATFQKFYLDTWMNWDSSGETSISQNIKPLRLHAVNAGNPNSASLVSVGDGIVICAVDGSSPSDNITDWWPNNDVTSSMLRTRGWVHVQIWQDFGTGGQTNGKCTIRLTGGINASVNYSTGLSFGRSGINDWKEFYIGNYVRSEDWSGTSKFYWDSVYVDNAWAHVELSDNATYVSATHREVQPATAWSDTSVTVKLNRGSFPANASAFLHVCNEANVCSAGRSVTLGGSPPPLAACADGLDNDADGLIDLADPGCANAADTDESDVVQPPVNCVVSAFTRQSVGPPLGACINGSQTTTEFWTRTITTMPANGGTACPALSENRTGSQACTVTPPPTGCAYNGAVDPVGTERYERLDASFNTSTHVLTVNAARLATLKAAKWTLTPLTSTTTAQWYWLTCTP